MGTWGHGCFQNDNARDWYARVCASLDVTSLVAAMAARGSEAEEAKALASAEIVAAFFGWPSPDFPLDNQWIRNLAVVPTMRQMAAKSVSEIKQKSRIGELWNDAGEFDEWVNVLDDLILRLRRL
jgi:Domain of unknown function (DUF4259)